MAGGKIRLDSRSSQQLQVNPACHAESRLCAPSIGQSLELRGSFIVAECGFRKHKFRQIGIGVPYRTRLCECERKGRAHAGILAALARKQKSNLSWDPCSHSI